MRRHHYATDRSGHVHIFHSPAKRNAWVHGRRSVDARTLTKAQARTVIGSAAFLATRESLHDDHFTVPPEDDPSSPCALVFNAVGHPYDGDPSPRQPHNLLTWEHGTINLAIFIDKPTPWEVHAFQQHQALTALLFEDPVIWMLFEIPSVYTAEAPFTPHLVAPDARHFPTLTPTDTRYPITVVMADATDGTVKTIRYTTLSPATSARLLDATNMLLKQPFYPKSYAKAIEATYQAHPTPGDMFRAADPPEPLGP